MLAAITGALLAAGVLVLARGLYPAQPDLRARLADFSDIDLGDTATNSEFWPRLAVAVLERTKGDAIEPLRADLDVTDGSLDQFAIEKARAGIAGAVLIVVVGVAAGFVGGALSLLVAAIAGGAGGYMLPDAELKKQASARRIEFARTLTAFTTLLSSSIAGGSGVNSSLIDATEMGDGWVFVHLRRALEEAKLNGQSVWRSLELLGRRLALPELVDLAGSLTLAGSSGARVTETLRARAESAREKELSEARAEAESKSSSLGAPIGLLLLAWVAFLGFPAVMSLGSLQ